jgi:dihydroorotase
MAVRYLLKNGIIVTPKSLETGSILIKGSKITKVFRSDESLPSVKEEELIDCTNCYIFPGIIDPHVHLRDFEQSHKETISSGTKAAISNGITTVLGMPNTIPLLDEIENIKAYIKKIKQTAHCNVGLFTHLPMVINQNYFHDLKKLGINGIKVYPGDVPKILNWELLLDLWEKLKEKFNEYIGDIKAFIHKLDVYLDHHYTKSQIRKFTESWEPILTELEKNKLHLLFHADVPLDAKTREIRFKTFEGIHKSYLKAHSANHSKLQELLHIYFVFQILDSIGVQKCPPITFCHISSIEAIQLIQDLKKLQPKAKIYIEITPHHTYLNDSIPIANQSHGKVLPPLRSEEDNIKIQNLVNKNRYEDIFYGTDHAPHTLNEKNQDFINAPAGFPSLDIYTKFLLSKFFKNEWDLRNFAFYTSYNPARIYQLKNKGWIRPGYDADLLIIRKTQPYSLDNNEFQSASQVNPYSLDNIVIRIEHVFLGGKIDQITSKGGFLPRSYKWDHIK